MLICLLGRCLTFSDLNLCLRLWMCSFLPRCKEQLENGFVRGRNGYADSQTGVGPGGSFRSLELENTRGYHFRFTGSASGSERTNWKQLDFAFRAAFPPDLSKVVPSSARSIFQIRTKLTYTLPFRCGICAVCSFLRYMLYCGVSADLGATRSITHTVAHSPTSAATPTFKAFTL